ncbi:hypothetical protein ACFQRB_19050 [Halobaculum litoreum]|uniref:Uncharacterized protein n=1 Tax=Halobaculum litoreum TaxID=3031998 RepID=A0ABD5XSA5_9EURY
MIDVEDPPGGMQTFLEAYLEEVPNLTGEGFDTPEEYRSKCPTRTDLEMVTDFNYSQVSYRFKVFYDQEFFDLHYEFVGRGTPRKHYYPKEAAQTVRSDPRTDARPVR